MQTPRLYRRGLSHSWNLPQHLGCVDPFSELVLLGSSVSSLSLFPSINSYSVVIITIQAPSRVGVHSEGSVSCHPPVRVARAAPLPNPSPSCQRCSRQPEFPQPICSWPAGGSSDTPSARSTGPATALITVAAPHRLGSWRRKAVSGSSALREVCARGATSCASCTYASTLNALSSLLHHHLQNLAQPFARFATWSTYPIVSLHTPRQPCIFTEHRVHN